jgi:hypothetical protein
VAEESQRYDLRAIRQLLLTAFTAEELSDLFYFSKTPELREVPNEFAPGDSLPTMVRKAVRYCDLRYLLGELLAEVKEANPRAYEKFGGTLGAEPGAAAPAKARPNGLLIRCGATANTCLIRRSPPCRMHVCAEKWGARPLSTRKSEFSQSGSCWTTVQHHVRDRAHGLWPALRGAASTLRASV